MAENWIKICAESNMMLEVNKKVLSFNSVKNDRCNLISIFGKARQGKSFFMNRLAASDKVFKVSNSFQPCTSGIDISNNWQKLSMFSQNFESYSESQIMIGFLDVEGRGDQGDTYDIKLICSILLQTKCIIYNWMGQFQRTDIMETLALIAKAAEKLAIKGSCNTDEKLLGHLHIVYRDWSLEGTEDKILEHIMNVEDGSTQVIKDRNHVRSVITKHFQSISIWLFPNPFKNKSDTEIANGDYCDEFNNKLESMREALSEQLVQPTCINKKELKGETHSKTVDIITNVLNQSEEFNYLSVYQTMIRQELDQFKEVLCTSLNDLVDNFLDRFSDNSPQVLPSSPNKSKADFEESASKLFQAFCESVRVNMDHSSEELSLQLKSEYLKNGLSIYDKTINTFSEKYLEKFKYWLQIKQQYCEKMITDIVKNARSRLPEFDLKFVNQIMNSSDLCTMLMQTCSKYFPAQYCETMCQDCPEVAIADECIKEHYDNLEQEIVTINESRIHESSLYWDDILDQAVNEATSLVNLQLQELKSKCSEGFDLSEIIKKSQLECNSIYSKFYDIMPKITTIKCHRDESAINYEQRRLEIIPFDALTNFIQLHENALKQAYISCMEERKNSLNNTEAILEFANQNKVSNIRKSYIKTVIDTTCQALEKNIRGWIVPSPFELDFLGTSELFSKTFIDTVNLQNTLSNKLTDDTKNLITQQVKVIDQVLEKSRFKKLQEEIEEKLETILTSASNALSSETQTLGYSYNSFVSRVMLLLPRNEQYELNGELKQKLFQAYESYKKKAFNDCVTRATNILQDHVYVNHPKRIGFDPKDLLNPLIKDIQNAIIVSNIGSAKTNQFLALQSQLLICFTRSVNGWFTYDRCENASATPGEALLKCIQSIKDSDKYVQTAVENNNINQFIAEKEFLTNLEKVIKDKLTSLSKEIIVNSKNADNKRRKCNQFQSPGSDSADSY